MKLIKKRFINNIKNTSKDTLIKQKVSTKKAESYIKNLEDIGLGEAIRSTEKDKTFTLIEALKFLQ